MSRPLPRYLHDDHTAWQQKLARILIAVGEPAPADKTYRWTAGAERELRGIPAIGRGVQGCIPGTSPHSIRS